MSHYGSGTEHALHCLLLLSNPDIKYLPSARDLAEFQGISVSYVQKIFSKLQKGKIVNSGEGVKGGYSLARPASEISVFEVVESVEGKKKLFNCKNIKDKCVLYKDSSLNFSPSTGVCTIHAVMIEAEQQMHNSLKNVSLKDIEDQVSGKLSSKLKNSSNNWFEQRNKERQLIRIKAKE